MDQRRKQNYARKRRHVSNISPDCHTNQTTINSTDSSKQINRPPNTRINERNGINFPTAKHNKALTNVKPASKPLRHGLHALWEGFGKSVAGKFGGTFCDDLFTALFSSSDELSLQNSLSMSSLQIAFEFIYGLFIFYEF